MSTQILHTEKYTLPIGAILTIRQEWRLRVSRDADPIFTFTRQQSPTRHFEGVDAFGVRDDFLNLRSLEDAHRFFERYGPFQYLPDKKTGLKGKNARPQAFRWSRIQEVQKGFEAMLLAEHIPDDLKWLSQLLFGQDLTLKLAFRMFTPELKARDSNWVDDAAIAPCDDIVDAMRASIYLSRMCGFPWSRCGRKGCGNLFEQTTQRRKLYCSPECAHLQAVNDYNARKKNALKARKKTPTKGR